MTRGTTLIPTMIYRHLIPLTQGTTATSQISLSPLRLPDTFIPTALTDFHRPSVLFFQCLSELLLLFIAFMCYIIRNRFWKCNNFFQKMKIILWKLFHTAFIPRVFCVLTAIRQLLHCLVCLNNTLIMLDMLVIIHTHKQYFLIILYFVNIMLFIDLIDRILCALIIFQF